MILSNLSSRGTLRGTIYRGGGGGITDYNFLSGKPQINGVTIEDNHDGGYYGLIDSVDIEVTEIYEIGYGSNYDINLNGAAVHVTNKIFKGATNSANGAKGLVPAPAAGSVGKVLSNEGWIDLPSGFELTYDNTEKVIGTYFGKPLYEKSYQNVAGTGTTVNVTLSDLSNIEDIFIVPEASASTNGIPFPYVHPSAVNMIGAFFTISNGVPTLNIRKGSDMASVATKYLTVRYTKTTD